MEFRPATILEQYISFDALIHPVAILHGTIYERCDEWDEMPLLDKQYDRLKKDYSPIDVEPAKESAIPKFLRHKLDQMSFVEQECYTVLASLTDSGNVYDVPKKLRELHQEHQEKAQLAPYFGVKTKNYAWIKEYKSRTYILRLYRTMFILYAFDSTEFKKCKAELEQRNLKTWLCEIGVSVNSYMETLFGFIVKKNKDVDFAISCWCEAGGRDRGDFVLEIEDGENISYLVNEGDKSLRFILRTTVGNAVTETECHSLEIARREMIESAMNYSWNGVFTTNMFGARCVTSTGYAIEWQILLRRQR